MADVSKFKSALTFIVPTLVLIGIDPFSYTHLIDDGILGVKKEPLALLNIISVKRGALKKGAQYDYAKAAKFVIDDFRSGRLGRISLERP